MSVPKLLARVLFFIACIALLVPAAFAQYRASLIGRVTDPSGALVPGAKLTLTDVETNRQLNLTSGPDGSYSFQQLAPSTYILTAEAPGFEPKTLDNINIRAEQANSVDVQLTAGGGNQTVTVNAEAESAIDTATGQIAGSVNQAQIATLPSLNRDPYQLAQLAPGVFGGGGQDANGGTSALPGNQGPGGSGGGSAVFSVENRPQVSAGGQRTDQNNITLDGASVNSVTWAGAAVITPTEDSIKELRVVSNSYDAEFGRASGAQIQALSQNGTNNFHGSAFIKIDRPGLNAYTRYDPNGSPKKNNDRNSQRFNQIGGSVGGPIWKNKVFFFFAYETLRNAAAGSSSGWYETAAVDKAARSGSIAAKFLGFPGNQPSGATILEAPTDNHDCASIGLVQGVNCNFIAGQGLDIGSPLSSALGTKDPTFGGHAVPGVGSGLDGVADLAFLSLRYPTHSVSQQFNGRLDFQVTQNDLVAFSIYHVPADNHFFNGPNGAVRGLNVFNHDQTNYAETLLWNHTFSGSLLNELRVNAAGWKWNEFASNPQTPYGLPQAHIVSASVGTTVGTIEPEPFGPNFGSIFNQNTYTGRETLTKIVNSHSLKFGVDYTKLEYLDDPTWNAQPTYNFNNLWDFLNDAPTSENVTVDPRTGIPSDFRKDTRQNVWGVFAKDDWKVRQNLTLNLGVRWEYFGGLYEKKGNLSTLELGTGANLLTNAKFVLGGKQVNAPKGNFGPQIGFAWSPMAFEGKTVLRGGFGIGYSGLEAAILTNVRFNPPFVTNGGLLTGNQITYGTAQNIAKFGQFPANPSLITNFDANNLPTAPGVSLNVTGLPRDLKTQYTYRYSLQAEQEIGHQWVGSVGYQGSMGRHLPLQTNLNALFAQQVAAGQLAFNPRLNFIDWYYTGGNSSFNALLTELRHRMAGNYEFDFQYRWSHSIDDGSGPFTNSYYIFGPAKFNRGNSDYDTRHFFKVWGLYSPKFFAGRNNFLEKTLGGWTLSSIFNLHSGFPWTPVYNGACDAFIPNSGQCQLLPASYNGQAGNNQGIDAFKRQGAGNWNGSNGSSFFTTPTFTTGSTPSGWTNGVVLGTLPTRPGIARNSFYGPRYIDVDATLTKAFGLPSMPVLGENARLEIRANAYNLFNNLNLTNIDNGIGDTFFGRANTVLGGRTVEFEAHFRF